MGRRDRTKSGSGGNSERDRDISRNRTNFRRKLSSAKLGNSPLVLGNHVGTFTVRLADGIRVKLGRWERESKGKVKLHAR